jgi:uncharacterized membrane protein
LKRYLITGLLVLIPLAITIWVLGAIVSTMDASLQWLVPEEWQPKAWLGYDLPGLGVLLTFVIVLLTGVLASNILGQRLVGLGDTLLRRIPVVNTLYGGVKQVSDTLFKPGGMAFRKAVLLRWPHAESWTIGFVTGPPGVEIAGHLPDDYIGIYVPTTPNPTSGYFVLMRRADIVELDMHVDDALKYVISMGVLTPGANRK